MKEKRRARDEIPEGGRELFETDRPGGAHERVRRSLIHAIVSGRFPTGDRLPSEPELTAIFGVSRPIVRQALEKLRAEGLVESLRGSGSYVARLDHLLAARLRSGGDVLRHARTMLEDLEFRQMLEPEAAFLAARRRSPEDLDRMRAAMEQFQTAHESGRITHHFDYLFHEAIARATANERFLDAARRLEYAQEDERLFMRHLIHFHPHARAEEVVREHGLVLERIAERDEEGARAAMGRHIEAGRLRQEEHLKRLKAERIEAAPPES
ncbi:FadR/GntR family transcriptional regulator [Neomegalonema sp.]|uniref:FadR/GntR family transcriptional regulator n=1 Tax=Neomegalonema sp. TaxID=2039713 RepID=UPI0026022F3E|nr:FCD domain-containing protein [Neomegalonema sp.]MDD2870219.1 FCD domain-containing protein [Neomegalonema sp.]